MLRIRPLMAALLAASLVLVAGCSSDDDTNTEATAAPTTTEAAATATTEGAASATETPMAMEHAESGADGMLVALSLVDGVGFHHIDDALNAGDPIEASWLGATNNARSAVGAIGWPADLTHGAEEFVAAAGDLATALEADAAAAAAPLATAAHEAQHHLGDMAYAYLADHSDADTMTTPHPAGMLAALAVIDAVGFHDIDDALNVDAPTIEASWLGGTQHAAIAAGAVIWPADLTEAADAFVTAANDLATALEADDAAAAAPLATAAHEAQHDLSNAGYDAVEAMTADGMAMAMDPDHTDTAGILVALTLADRVGFHAIDDALNGDAPAIQASWLGATSHARIAAAAAHWPADLEAGAMAFVTGATALATALEADDVAAAAPLAATAHEAQHDLSTAGFAYVASMAGLDGAMVMDDHTHSGDTVEAPAGLSLTVGIEARPGAIAISVDAPGLTIVTPGADTPHVDGEGHIHVLVDGVEVGMFFENDIVVTSVPAGMHEVVVGLSTNTHEGYARDGAPIEVMAMVEVPAP